MELVALEGREQDVITRKKSILLQRLLLIKYLRFFFSVFLPTPRSSRPRFASLCLSESRFVPRRRVAVIL